MATHRHRKPDFVKKEENIPDSHREDMNHHQVLATGSESRRFRYTGLVRTDATCNKHRVVVHTDKSESASAVVEMPAHVVALPRQSSNNSTFFGRADLGQTLGRVAERCWSVKGEDAVATSALGQWVKTSKLSNCESQQARPGKVAVKTKPNVLIKRDSLILSNRTEPGESPRSIIDITTKTFKQQNNSVSLERQSIGLIKTNKEEGQGGKQSFAGYSTPSTKNRLMKDTSSRASTQSKSVMFNRSPSPTFTVEQQSQKDCFMEQIIKDCKLLKPEGDRIRQNRQLSKKVNSGSKSTHANIHFSKSRLEQRQRKDDDNKNVADGTDIAVARIGRVSNVSGSQSRCLGNRTQADESTRFGSPAIVTSSISDTSVSDPKQQQPPIAGRKRQNGTERSISEKRREFQAEFTKRARFVKYLDTPGKSDNTDHVSAVHRSGFSRRDVKPETLSTVYRPKYDINGRIINPTLCANAVAHEQESIDRKGVSPVKLNTSANTANGYNYHDKFTVTTKRENVFSKASTEDKKQASKVHTKIYKTTINPMSSSQNVPETRGNKFAVLTKINQRTNKRDKDINDRRDIDYTCKEGQKADWQLTNDKAHIHEAAPLSNLVNLDALVQSVSTGQLLSTNSLVNICHAGSFKPDVTQCDILPVIYFCWQKCPDQGSEESLTKPDLPKVVSLDQGLSVLRTIMTEVTSESTLYSQEFTLNQLIIKDSRSLPNCGVINNQDQFIVTGACFELKPRFKMKSNQVKPSEDSTSISPLAGLFNGGRTSLTGEGEQTMLREKNSDIYPLGPILGQRLCGKNDIQTVVNISKAIKNSFQRRLNMTSLWSFVSNGITAFFLCPLEIPRITYLDPGVDLVDDNGSTVDEINTSLNTRHRLHDCKLHRHNTAVVSWQRAKPVVGQGPATLAQVIAKETASSCPNFETKKQLSDRKINHNFNILSKGNGESSSTNNTMQSNLIACRKTTDGVKEVLNLDLGKTSLYSCDVYNTGQMSTLTDHTEISKQSLGFSENTPAFTNTHSSSSEDVEHRLEKCEKEITHGEKIRIDYASKERSLYSHSNPRIQKSTHSLNSNRNEISNIPFSTQVYESLEGPQNKADCNIVLEQHGDIANRTYENDELAFIAPSENCPDPGVDDLENNTFSDLTAKLSSCSRASLKQFPHLVWTRKYSQSLVDSQGQPDFKADSNHLICGKDYVQEQNACTLDDSVKGVNCSVSTDSSPCQLLCHEIVPQTHESLTDDVNKIWGNAKVKCQHITSADIPCDDYSKDGCCAKLTYIRGHRQSVCRANTKEPHSLCETNEGMTSQNNTNNVNLPDYDCSRNLMKNSAQFDKNVQSNHVASCHYDANSGPDYSEMLHGKCTYNKYSNEDRDHSARVRNHPDYISETRSRNTNTRDTSGLTVGHSVTILTERPHSSELAPTSLESCSKQDTSEVALEINEHHGNFLDIQASHDTKFNTLKKMIKTLVRTKECSLPSGQSGQNISTGDDENTASEQSLPRPTTSNQSLQLFSIDNITRAALALKEVSESHISYICSSHASACSYLIRVGCSRPFGDTWSNLISAQQLARHSERRMLDKYGSSVDDRTLNNTNENFVDNHVYGDMHKFPLSDSFQNSNMDIDLPKSISYEGKHSRKGTENSTKPNDSSELGNVHQRQQETASKLSLTNLSGNFSKTANLKVVNEASETTSTNEQSTFLSVSTSSTQSGNARSNYFSNNSQKESNKARAAEHLPRINDPLTPNACRSDEGPESGIFSYYSLASPTITQITDLDNGGSSSESFKSVCTQNSGLP